MVQPLWQIRNCSARFEWLEAFPDTRLLETASSFTREGGIQECKSYLPHFLAMPDTHPVLLTEADSRLCCLQRSLCGSEAFLTSHDITVHCRSHSITVKAVVYFPRLKTRWPTKHLTLA